MSINTSQSAYVEVEEKAMGIVIRRNSLRMYDVPLSKSVGIESGHVWAMAP